MEDSHAAVLSLDEGVENSNSFFGVYDGHSGVYSTVFYILISVYSSCSILGRSVAAFAGDNVHKRLVAEEAYLEKRYEEGLKAAFLRTDHELLASQFLISICWRHLILTLYTPQTPNIHQAVLLLPH